MVHSQGIPYFGAPLCLAAAMFTFALLCEKWLQQHLQTEPSEQPDVQANAIQNCAYIIKHRACKTGAVFAAAGAVVMSFMHI